MEIDISLTAFLIIFLAVLPGVPGAGLYHKFIGLNRHEEIWQRILRILLFSVSGLAFYIIIADWLNLPIPDYIFPSFYNNNEFSQSILLYITKAYIGHFFGSILISIIAIIVLRLLFRWRLIATEPEMWNLFIRNYADKHWAIVSLVGGKTYIGQIESNISVEKNERDIILTEPGIYDETKKAYIALNYQNLFIPADKVNMVSIVRELSDKRITKPGQIILLNEEESNENAKRG